MMTVPKFRSLLYFLAKILGDFRAIKTGRVAKRIGWRVSGKLTGRGLGSLWR